MTPGRWQRNGAWLGQLTSPTLVMVDYIDAWVEETLSSSSPSRDRASALASIEEAVRISRP